MSKILTSPPEHWRQIIRLEYQLKFGHLRYDLYWAGWNCIINSIIEFEYANLFPSHRIFLKKMEQWLTCRTICSSNEYQFYMDTLK